MNRKVPNRSLEGEGQCCRAIERWIASAVDARQLFGDAAKLGAMSLEALMIDDRMQADG